MKITKNKYDMEQNFKIAVPEGCTAYIKQENGFLVVTFEPKEWKPKDGDVYVTNDDGIGIYNANRDHPEGVIPCYLGLTKEDVLNIWTEQYTWGFGREDTMRPATEEEKQRLFDALAKEGKRWNAEEKRIEDLPRWRAKMGDFYFCIEEMLGIGCHAETMDDIDNSFYTSGNYFKTREAAEKVAKQVREIFKESKAE